MTLLQASKLPETIAPDLIKFLISLLTLYSFPAVGGIGRHEIPKYSFKMSNLPLRVRWRLSSSSSLSLSLSLLFSNNSNKASSLIPSTSLASSSDTKPSFYLNIELILDKANGSLKILNFLLGDPLRNFICEGGPPIAGGTELPGSSSRLAYFLFLGYIDLRSLCL